jgi:Fe-S cluster assembly ATPase SufC
VQGKTILNGIATVREAIAYAETTNKALCILSLDFQAAFDNISHTYLFQILQAYGFSEAFKKRIKTMYEGATAAVQINGNISSTIPVKSSIRQGCPLRMQLYALCLNPLLCMLDETLSGIRIDPQNKTTT